MGSVAKAKVAFITGGNGITGSAITEYLAENTTKEEWSQIIVTSRSPFKTLVNDPRIKFVPLDFTKDADTLVTEMADICRSVTHAYFSSYVHKDDFEDLNSANQALFENFLSAIVRVAPELQSVALQTGGKYYNVSCTRQGKLPVSKSNRAQLLIAVFQVHARPVPSPAMEDAPRLVSSEHNFYYPQEDYLVAKQKGANWKWNVIRPEAIIGTNKQNHIA